MKSYEEMIKSTIKRLGVPANLSGYRYIASAIELMMDDAEYICSTMNLYAVLGVRFNTTVQSVERAIRHAIKIGWERCDVSFADKLFSYSISSEKCRPTNSEFLATVADYVSMQGGGEE